ncbi:MAG: SulP family inorganic anion transporter [Betaproteobacteria bacterium]|nr:SulP family inorganic anion transporter [Betaproteobacteria bacterium]
MALWTAGRARVKAIAVANADTNRAARGSIAPTMKLGNTLAGDAWGGLAATLVALPAAIAFGVTIVSPLGGGYAAQGALAGILGATALGLVAGSFGGTQRLVSAPCAPAAAVLSALAVQLAEDELAADAALLVLTLTGIVCGALQVVFGRIGLGRLIKYMPYPVVSGYMYGVGLIIIASQVPRLLGAPREASLWTALGSPALWSWQAIVVGVATAATMFVAPRLTKIVPATILALAAGMLAYFGLALADASLRTLEGNPLVIGALAGAQAGERATPGRWVAFAALDGGALLQALLTGMTLAVLLSIDTLKTCIVTDALTRTRHDSNRELLGQGLGNLASAFAMGVPGAGTMGATLVNISSGARTRLSGVFAGAFALLAFLLLAPAIAWLPIAALAGILIVIGVRMFDLDSLQLARSRATVLDFVVVLAVVVVAETVGLIAASGVGIALAILLFVREQTGGAVVRRQARGNRMFSKQVRLPDEMAILDRHGAQCAIFELQGSLFFGTSEKLYRAVEEALRECRYLILDMRRVQSVDLTATHVLDQIADMLAERGAYLLLSQLPRDVPSGQDMRRYFDATGLVRPEGAVRAFAELDAALEWVENRILDEHRVERAPEQLLELQEMAIFRGRKPETLAALEACMEKRSVAAGEVVFSRGDADGDLYLIRRGTVRILLPIDATHSHHIATFGRGDFFGEMAFLDRHPRSANAVATADTDLYVLARERFDALADQHRALADKLMEGLARTLATRLRYANAELRLLGTS